MTREKVIERLEDMAVTNATCERLLRYLEQVAEVDPEKFEEIMKEMGEEGN